MHNDLCRRFDKITSSEVNAKKRRMVGGKPKSKQNKNFEF